MLSGNFISKNWLCANENYDKSDIVMVGIPYDGTCSFRPGSRFAPGQIRLASIGLEEYSPLQNKSLEEISFYDAGELDLSFGNREKVLSDIRQTTKSIIDDGKKFLGIGGEHLITLPSVEAHLNKYPDLCIIHFDAHADLRQDYLGEELSHATVMRQIATKSSPQSLVQIGIRSGTKEEFDFMAQNNTLVKSQQELQPKLDQIGDRPVFISIDLDCLDPSIMCGTGTPEPGGMSFKEFINYLQLIKGKNIVGADVVELAPDYDPSGASTITAAKVIREVLLML